MDVLFWDWGKGIFFYCPLMLLKILETLIWENLGASQGRWPEKVNSSRQQKSHPPFKGVWLQHELERGRVWQRRDLPLSNYLFPWKQVFFLWSFICPSWKGEVNNSFAKSWVLGESRGQAGEHTPFALQMHGVSNPSWEDVLWVQETQHWVRAAKWENICGVTELRRKKMKAPARQRTEIGDLGKLGRSKIINGEGLSGSIAQEIEKVKRGVEGWNRLNQAVWASSIQEIISIFYGAYRT